MFGLIKDLMWPKQCSFTTEEGDRYTGGFIFGVYDNWSYSYGFNYSNFIIFWSSCSVPLIVLLIFKSIYGD